MEGGMFADGLLQHVFGQRDLHRAGPAGGGQAEGLAHHFGIDVGLMRVLYVLVSILSAAFPGILVYIIMWIVIPEEPAA